MEALLHECAGSGLIEAQWGDGGPLVGRAVGGAAGRTQPGKQLQLHVARVVGAGDREAAAPGVGEGDSVTGAC